MQFCSYLGSSIVLVVAMPRRETKKSQRFMGVQFHCCAGELFPFRRGAAVEEDDATIWKGVRYKKESIEDESLYWRLLLLLLSLFNDRRREFSYLQ